ncbi:hypothetical protein CHL76_00140 [Marinococcus halophilus]|nr:hypothetical protein CHL76_00140 [Marinococcus halophilus]
MVSRVTVRLLLLFYVQLQKPVTAGLFSSSFQVKEPLVKRASRSRVTVQPLPLFFLSSSNAPLSGLLSVRLRAAGCSARPGSTLRGYQGISAFLSTSKL